MLASCLCGKFLLHIPCWLCFYVGSFSDIPRCLQFYEGSFSYTLRAGFIMYIIVCFYLSREFLFQFPCWFLCLSREFLLHIPRWFRFYLGSFSYTSRAGCNFIRGLKHPMLSSFDISRASLIFMGGVSLTHPMLTLFLCGEFVLDIQCRFHFYLGSFSYTSHAGLIFMQGVSLTHPVLAFFIFNLRSFSYTSHAGFSFISGVFLTHPMPSSFLSAEFLLHIPC